MPFVLVGLLLVKFGRRKQVYQITGLLIAALAILFFVVLAARLVPHYMQIRREYKDGQGSVVEGRVESFRPAPALGAAVESFSVGGVDFFYNVLEATPCFHNAPYRKGPIKADLYVRVTYKSNCIQRVEIRR